MRVILYSGKGGVGKTSVAAATALHCAELGYRTLVISTDAALTRLEASGKTAENGPTKIEVE